MTAWTNILGASDDGGLINITILLVLVGISVLGGWMQKRSERKQEGEVAERKRKDRQLRKTIIQAQGRDQQPAAEPAPRREPPAPWQQVQPAPQPEQPPPAIETVQLPPHVAEPIVERVARAPLVQPAQAEEPLRRLRRRGTPLVSAQLGEISEARTEARAAQPVRNPVRLKKAAQARAAIIYHEIFAAPKALRAERESWDL